MSQNQEERLVCSACFAVGTQGGAQAALALRDGAFNVPALSETALGEVKQHPAAIPPAHDRAAQTTTVDRDDGAADSKLLAGKGVKFLGVVGAIRIQRLQPDRPGGLPHRGLEMGRVVVWSARHHRRRKQVRAMMTNQPEFCPPSELFEPPTTFEEIAADVPTLQSRAVNRAFHRSLDQAGSAGPLEDGTQQSDEDPFFKSPCAAFWSVVK